MSIYDNCKILIETNNYIKDDMIKKLDVYLLMDRITSEQYQELFNLINLKKDIEKEGMI